MSANVSGELPSHQGCPITLDFDPHNISSFPKSAIPTWTAVSTISGIIALPTVYINLLVIWTVLENERLRSANYNLLLALLSLTDLLVGLLVQPLFVFLNVCIIKQCSSTCFLTTIYVIVGLLCGGWSLVTMMIISLERYLAINYPLYYQINVTTKNLMTATAITWFVVAIGLVIGRWLSNTSYKIRQIPVALVIAVSVVVIIFCLTNVMRTAFRQMRAINVQQAAVQQTSRKGIKEYKRTFTLGIILIASVIFFCPSLIIKVIGVAKGKAWNDDFQYISQFIWISFVHFQSLINPLILSLRLSYIRTGVLKKLYYRI